MEKEGILRAWEQTDASLGFAALERLALEQGWISVPEENQEALRDAAHRYDQAFHEARKQLFEEILSGEDPQQAAQRFGQRLNQITKEFVLSGIRLGERSGGRALLEVLEELPSYSLSWDEREEIAKETGFTVDQLRRMEEEARNRLQSFVQEIKAELAGEEGVP